MKGLVRLYYPERGFGFLQTDESKDIFFHISDVTNGTEIEKGTSVEFTLVETKKGLSAEYVVIFN